MRWLITGSSGILGSSFVMALSNASLTIAERSELDVTRPERIEHLISQNRPDIVVNCAAHTDVDGAEDHPDAAYAANVALPNLLARACYKSNSLLIQISSTGCYGNWKDEPFTEEDELRPMSVHHRSKRSGEHAVVESGCEHLIIRTGWLFGGTRKHAKNFVYRRLLQASQISEMTSDASQRGNPTWVDDVVKQVIHLCALDLRGTFNVVSQGHATRHEYVSSIIELSQLSCVVRAGPSFERRAIVSHNEAALNRRLDLQGCSVMRHWRAGLTDYLSSESMSDEVEMLRDCPNGTKVSPIKVELGDDGGRGGS